MEDERVISFERGKQLADQLGVEFFETSAKENVNVKVTYLILQCLYLLYINEPETTNSIFLYCLCMQF